MMQTRTDTTLWVGADTQVELGVTERCAWITVDGVLTIHSVDYQSGASDVAAMEAFFRKGLDAIAAYRYPRLTGMVDDGR